MDPSKPLATGLSISRILFGATYLLRPQQARSNWIGRAAKKPGAQVMIRSQASVTSPWAPARWPRSRAATAPSSAGG